MAFEFKRKQSLAKGLRRLAQAQVESALDALANHDRLEAVHDVRKTIKKLRSLLRLVRSGLGGSAYRGANAPLRECARLLSRPRDFHVKFDAFTELVHNFDAELASRPFPKTRQLLADDCRRAEREFKRQKTALRARTLLQRFARQAESLKLKPSGWRALAPGIKRTYRAARRAHRLVLREGTAENFHEWRKQTKTLLYQVQLLCPIWPEQMCAAKAELKHLGQLLGDDHDLVLLSEPELAKRFRAEDEEEAAALKALLELRQKEWRAQALALGGRFYQEKPTAFCKRLAAYWKRWRREPKQLRLAKA